MKTMRRFLVMLLVLAQLMMITYGAMPETVSADEAQLMCIWADWPDGESGWKTGENESLQAEISGLLGRTWMLVFYYGTETNPGVPIQREKLSFPDFVTATVTEYVAEGYEQAVIELTFTGTGSDYITYKVDDNTTVQLPITVTLPGAGLYSSTTASDETYLLSATWTGDETYYIVPAGAYSDYQITSIESESIPSYLNVEVSGDGTSATVTVDATEYDAQMPNGRVQMKVNMQHETNSVLEWCGFQIIDGRNTEGGDTEGGVPDSGDTDGGNTDEAQLMYVWAGDGYPSIENADSFYKNLTEWVGLRDYYAFFCGDTNDYGEAIDLANLSFPDFVRVTEVKGVNEDYKGKILCIEFVKCGSGYISYTVDGKPIAQMPISVTLPPVGLYSETTASESSYLGIDITWTGEETYNICLAPEYSDWTITRITDLPEYMSVEYKGTYAVLTIDNETFTEQSWVSFRVYRQQNGEEGKEYFNGVGFSLTDGRTEETLPVVGIYSSAEPSVESYLGGNFDYIGEHHGMFRICLSPKYSSYSIQKIEFVSQPEYLWVDEINGIYANLMIDAEVYDQKASNCDLVEARVYLRDQSTPFICSFMITDARSGGGSSEDNQPEEMLPVVGIYSSAEPSADSYLGTDIKWTGKETYYIVPAGNRVDYKITSIELESIPSYLNVEVNDDGAYATVTVDAEEYDAQMPEGWVEMQVNLQHKTEESWTNRNWCSFQITDGRAGFYALGMNWDGELLVPDFSYGIKTIECSLGDSWNYAFGFGTPGDQMELLTRESLEFPEFLQVQKAQEVQGGISQDYASNIFYITVLGIGSGNIRYTVGDETYNIPVTVKLPELALYTTDSITPESFVKGQSLVADMGQSVSGWMLWSPDDLGTVEAISVRFGDEASVEISGETEFEDYGITIEPDCDNGKIKVTYVGGAETRLTIRLDTDQTVYLATITCRSSIAEIWDNSLKHGEITYKGSVYTVNYACFEQERFSLTSLDAGDAKIPTWTDEDVLKTIFIGAIKDYKTENAVPAEADFYRCIQNVTVEIVDWVNMDENGNVTSNVNVGGVYSYDMLYGRTKALNLTANNKDYFAIHLATTITFCEDGKEPQIVTFETGYFYYPFEEMDTDIICSFVLPDTADALNAAVASADALVSWLNEAYPEKMQEIEDRRKMAAVHPIFGDPRVYVTLILPAAEYDKVIYFSADRDELFLEYDFLFNTLCGTVGDEGELLTVLPGLAMNSMTDISEVAFKGKAGCTMTVDGETFTCGVFAYGNTPFMYATCCTFENLDYGVRGHGSSFVMDYGNNRYVNCGVGYWIDAAEGEYRVESWPDTTQNVYINCDTAIKITSLPQGISAYYCRFTQCDFINNGCDFDVSAPGVFYFYANYYGALLPDVEMPTSSLDMVYRLPIIRGEDEDTLVVTNPRYAFAISYPSDALGNFLVVDLLRPLIVINGEAGNLVFDSNDFSEKLEEAEEDCEIVIVDEKEEQKGKWKFDKDKKKDKDKDKQ